MTRTVSPELEESMPAWIVGASPVLSGSTSQVLADAIPVAKIVEISRIIQIHLIEASPF
jgi:hypothetical protein